MGTDTEIELWPEDGEQRGEFMDRCIRAMIKCVGRDRAHDICSEKWDGSLKLGTKQHVTRAMVTGNAAIEPCGESCIGCKGADAPFPRYSEDDRRRIMAAARATLERTANVGERENI